METDSGKLFATFYAIFSGVAFLGTTGILVAPWAHRLLHRFHADLDDAE
jgi:cobalamin biosynthesis protein CbiD